MEDRTKYHSLMRWKKRRNRLEKTLIRKYGSDIIRDFKDLETKHYWDMGSIAKKYGLSRERIRQIYNRLSLVPYRIIRKRKRIDRENQKQSMDRFCDPRQKVSVFKENSLLKKGADIELLAFQKMIELNMQVEFQKNTIYDMIVNGHKVDIKGCYCKKTNGGLSKYFHFGVRKNQLEQCKFIICYAVPIDTFYIIPVSILNSTSIFIRTNNRYSHSTHPELAEYYKKRGQKYSQYKEAWHLLK